MGNALTSGFRSSVNRYAALESAARKVVVITGCDSGLGYSLSVKCREMGLTVVSGCLNPDSAGARLLANGCVVHGLDLRDPASVTAFASKVADLTKDGKRELHAVVNNAGVMIFGEFEWYTEAQVLDQVQVNLIGSFRTAKAFLPLLRKTKGRLINVTSHCALSNLPNLTVYGATKSALQSWSDGLRQEQKKYGVKVITFMPGSFATQSNIMASQGKHFDEMRKSLSADDERLFGGYMTDFGAYLSHVADSVQRHPGHLSPIDDDELYGKFAEALLADRPNVAYRHEPWRYFFYYTSFRVAPTRLKDYLINRFLRFPEFKPTLPD